MKRFRSFATAWLAFALTLTPMFTLHASAQATTGGFRGVVSDVNGAVLPNATVVAKNTGTGVEYRAVATGEGLYSISRIPPGRYTVTVEVQGFKKGEYKDV